MKQLQKFVKLGLGSAMALSMTACSSGGSSAAASTTQTETVDAQKEYGCNAINVYNAGEYIDTAVLSAFEKQYSARVNYDTFDSNETMYTKLLGGSSYDVIVPSDYMIERMISEDMLQPLNQDQQTNEADYDPAVLKMRDAYDKDGKYSVPYFWGSVGLVYDKTVVSEDDIKSEGWNILKDTKYKGNIYYYDSQRDGFMVAFKALGYSMNTENEDEIQAAYKWLREMNDTMEPAYVTDEVIDGMVNGNKGIAIMYSGDAAYVLSQNENMAWVEPDQGTNIWSDSMVIPKNASCAGLANEFINYMASYDVQLANTTAVGYTSVRSDVEKEMTAKDGDYYENDAYTVREDGKNDEVFHYNEKLTKALSDLWNKVKVQ
jgi:spermidine/putrescine transport system substrate-binding protein/spermidine/putrescine transport system permease protein